MNTLNVKITGVSPILMHNGQTADPLNKWTKLIKAVSSKRKKVDADYEEMARLEWYAGLYTKNQKIVVPGDLLEACIRDAGRTKKLGKVVLGAVFVPGVFELNFPENDQELDQLWLDENHRFSRAVVIQRARIMRMRPIFEEWSFEATVHYDEMAINKDSLLELLDIAGTKGLGDWRPKYGRFVVEVV